MEIVTSYPHIIVTTLQLILAKKYFSTNIVDIITVVHKLWYLVLDLSHTSITEALC